MNKIAIPDILYKNIIEFCKLNNILDYNKFIIKLLQIGFNIEKYGISPLQREQQVQVKETKEDDNSIKVLKAEQQQKEETLTQIQGKRVRIIKTDSTK